MFKLEFSTDNAAFDGDSTEAVRILRDVAAKIGQGYTDGKVTDFNGNTIGRFALTEG